MPPDIVPFLAILGFAAFWVLILNLVGYGSGWWALASVYPHTGEFKGKLRRGRSLRLNSGNYNGAVTVGTNAEGLHLATIFLFRPGHPPLFIPWTDITAKVTKGWFGARYLELNFTQAPGIRVQFPEKLGNEIAADANQAWDFEEAVKHLSGDSPEKPT
jgi:hypothetical protein